MGGSQPVPKPRTAKNSYSQIPISLISIQLKLTIYIQFTYNLVMATKTFNISFPKELADKIDKKAKQQFGSRSDFLRYAALKYLRAEEELKELMAYGKTFAKTTSHKTEAEVAEYFTNKRRKQEPWRKNIAKFKNRPR